MFSGTFRHPTDLLPLSFKLRSQTRKKVENFLKILFVYRTFFTPFLRFYPPSASGERSFALPASLNRASSPPLPRTRLRFGGKQRCTPALYFYQYLTAARMTPSACADRPAEPPHRRGSGRGAVTSALSLPYNMSFPPFACRGLRGVCGAIGAPF